MLYKCNHCNYATKRRGDLIRHENRKTLCYKKIEESVCKIEETQKVSGISQNVSCEPQNVNGESQNVNGEPQNVNGEPQNVSCEPQNVSSKPKSFNCTKCNKTFDRKDNLIRHESKCDGYDKRQCKICLRMFTTRQAKHNHLKYVKCNPPVIQSSPSTSYNNCYNNTTNNYNNTINFNIRGNFDKITKEDIQKIVKQLEESEYIKMVQNNMSKGKYVIPRTIEHLYFNDDHPEMQTLKKERRNDKMVEVHVDGKWEKRMMDDILKKLIGKVEDYHTNYCKYLEEQFKDIPIGSKEWNQKVRPIKNFGHMMLWYNGFTGKDIENIGIELNSPDDNKEKKAKNKDMAKIVNEKIYEFTPKSLVIT